jgi:hypothetical protein
MDLDRELRQVLARKAAPEGFERRLTARLGRERPPRRWVAPMALAASLMVGVFGFQEYERVRARKAHQDLAVALGIASSKIELAEMKAREALLQ